MFLATDTSWAPWYVVHSDNKRRARLNILTHILSKIPYQELPRAKVELPKRQHHGDYKDPDYPFRLIPEVYGGRGFRKPAVLELDPARPKSA
jgi:hypothetical protein